MKRMAIRMAITLAGSSYLVSFALAAAEPDQATAVLEEMSVEGDWLGAPTRRMFAPIPADAPS